MELVTAWRDEARAALDNRSRKLTIARISKETGLSEHWIRQFSQGRIDNPGVNYIQTLLEFLAAQKA